LEFVDGSEGAAGHDPGRRPIVEHCCSAALGSIGQPHPPPGFPEPHQKLAKVQISCCNIRHNRIQAVRLCVSRPENSADTKKPACGAAREKAWPRLFYIQTRRQAMQKGTVKWFNPTKGYGFIKPMVGEKDVFVHISAVERAGLSTLNENQVVEYDLVENRGKSSAENLRVS
jgi:cold shock protein